MATIKWQGPGGTTSAPTSGDWDVGTNWKGGNVPASSDSVDLGGTDRIDEYTVRLNTGDPPITIDVASITINSVGGANLLVGDNSLQVTTLTLAGTISNDSVNQVTMLGGTLQATTISLQGNSLISGSGAIDATHINGAGTIEAGNDGTLDVTGTIAATVTLAISTQGLSADPDLKIEGTATQNNAISITQSTQTLEVGGAGSLTINAAENITGGTIKLDGGTLKDTAGIIVGAGAELTGFGTVNTGSNSTDIKGGSVVASGGPLTFQDNVDQASAGTFTIDTGATLAFDKSVGLGTTIDFDAGVPANPDTLDLTGEGSGVAGEISKFQGSVSNFEAGDQILVKGVDNTDRVTLLGDSTLEVWHGTTLEAVIGLNGDYAGQQFTLTNPGSGSTTDTITICFMAGTQVRTPMGEVAVETLGRGDLVVTSDGRAVPVTWLGRQTVSTKFGDPLRVLPIRIKAGALGDNVPSRDLLLSPDHAVLIEGALIQAGALVNGTSIVRETNVPQVFTYYHVETDDHSLILAENTPAETFVDNVDRLNFDNWAEHQALYPDGKPITELPYPRAKAHRQVPVHMRVKLAERAHQIGAVVSAASVA